MFCRINYRFANLSTEYERYNILFGTCNGCLGNSNSPLLNIAVFSHNSVNNRVGEVLSSTFFVCFITSKSDFCIVGNGDSRNYCTEDFSRVVRYFSSYCMTFVVDVNTKHIGNAECDDVVFARLAVRSKSFSHQRWTCK